MANYTPTFTKPYPSGWVDKPSKTTPATAAIMNSYDTAIAALEAYLRDNAIKNVSANTTVKSGTKTATITIDGTEYVLYSPSVSYESAITGGTKVGTITVGTNTFDIYAPTASAGGSTVSVVPKTLTGTNIAEITVDGTTYQLYAPTGGGSTVTAEATLTEGTQIGKITIDGTETILYAPNGGGGSITVDSALSTESENPVQNKAIAEEFQKYANGTKVVAKATEADTATTASNAEKVNGHTVGADVPSNAVFTDTVYDDSAVKVSIQNIVNGTTQVGNATKATQDAQGNVIDTTYAKKTEVPQGTVVDDALSSTSANPVQNKVVKAEFDQVNSNLVDQKMLGWSVPSECPIQNYVDSDGVFHQRVGRVDLEDALFEYNGTYSLWSSNYIKNIAKYSTTDQMSNTNFYSNMYSIYNGNLSYMPTDSFIIGTSGMLWVNTGSSTEKPSGYFYFELAKENAISVDGNEAVTKVNESLTDINMLGWTVPKECPVQNYVDGDGVFHQRVGRVDLGSLNYVYQSDFNRFVAHIPDKIIPSSNTEWTRGLYCSIYKPSASPITSSGEDMTITGYNGVNDIFINNFSYTDATTFKNAMKGVYLYYELAEEKTISVDGNEAVTQIKNDLSNLKDGTTPAAKAVADEDGNNIKSTYAKKTEVPSGSIVDSELSATSDNAIQNKVVKAEFDKVNSDLDKLNSLPIGSIIQIEEDKDDIETTTQKYGWQYLGTSNIQYDIGSANILVTHVYRKNN